MFNIKLQLNMDIETDLYNLLFEFSMLSVEIIGIYYFCNIIATHG